MNCYLLAETEPWKCVLTKISSVRTENGGLFTLVRHFKTIEVNTILSTFTLKTNTDLHCVCICNTYDTILGQGIVIINQFDRFKTYRVERSFLR